jgi:predicted RNase H-like HicB family nuclease
MKTYTVIFERDERGWWVASVREVSGCHTQGRSIRQARARIREALALFVKDGTKARFVEDVKLPARVRRMLQRQREARDKADKELARAQDTTREAVRALTQALHLSVRDASELLGLSHQRVQQLQAP